MSLYKSDKELELLPTLQKIDSLGEDVKLLIKKLERIETDLKEIRKEILDN
jgi:outer membrane murein-binding lipoprotein Lpp